MSFSLEVSVFELNWIAMFYQSSVCMCVNRIPQKVPKKLKLGIPFFFFWNLLETARKIILGVFWGIWYSVKYFKSKQETQTRILSPSLHVFGELYYAGYLCSCNLELHHLVSCATHRIFPWVSPFSCGRMRLIVF